MSHKTHDVRIQNLVKDLRLSVLEKWLYLLTVLWQGYEYASRHNNGRVLNIPGFRICQISACVSITQGSEYDWIWLNNAWINWLLWLWQSSEYACSKFYRILNMPLVSKYAKGRVMARLWICEDYAGCWICLN